MSFDRSKFRATQVDVAIKKDEELKQTLGKKEYTSYLKIDDSKSGNLFRIYPPHPYEMGGGDVFAEPKVVCFLPMLVEEKNDKGEVVTDSMGRAKLVEKQKSVFNSRIHGGLEKDLVEEYVKYALQVLEEKAKMVQSVDEQLKIQNQIEAIKGSYQKKINGLKYNQSWVMYVDKITFDEERNISKKFGLLEIKPAVKNALNTLAASTDSQDNPISTDPFTDPDHGRAIKIFYNPKPTSGSSNTYYTVVFDSVTELKKLADGSSISANRTFPLSDKELEAFSEEEPLAKKFRGVFSQRDFTLQMNGLELFDKKHGIGIFNTPEFVSIIEEIAVTVPDKEEDEEEDQPAQRAVRETASAPIQAEKPLPAYQDYDEDVEEDSKTQSDIFDLMTRKELGQWHRDHKTGVQITPVMSDDQIREYARNFVEDMGGVENVEKYAKEQSEQEQQQEADLPSVNEVPSSSGEVEKQVEEGGVRDRLAEMKSRVLKKK